MGAAVRIAVAAIVLASCGNTPPALVEPQGGGYVHWCFRVSGIFEGKRQEAELCFEEARACWSARAQMKRWGGLADVDQVGGCIDW